MQDQVLRLVHERKREEHYAFMTTLAFIVGHGLRVPVEAIQRMLELYGLELYQDRYRPAHIESLRKTRNERRQKRLTDERMLLKVAAMDVPEERLPPKDKKKRRR